MLDESAGADDIEVAGIDADTERDNVVVVVAGSVEDMLDVVDTGTDAEVSLASLLGKDRPGKVSWDTTNEMA